MFHGPGWVPRPTFVAEVTALAATESWVVEWQYDQVRSLLLARADLLVWLDLSRTRVFAQLLSRTVVRRLRRVELWNGNHEPPLHTIFTDPEHVVRWAWGSYFRIGPRVQDCPLAARPPLGRAAPQPSGDPAVARAAGVIATNPTFPGFDHRRRRSRRAACPCRAPPEPRR